MFTSFDRVEVVNQSRNNTTRADASGIIKKLRIENLPLKSAKK